VKGRRFAPSGYPFDVIYRTGLDASTDGLRHTCVSLLLALGVHSRVVMEIVVHSAIEMTMNVYGHTNVDTQRVALDRLDDELSG
jgi:integrase